MACHNSVTHNQGWVKHVPRVLIIVFVSVIGESPPYWSLPDPDSFMIPPIVWFSCIWLHLETSLTTQFSATSPPLPFVPSAGNCTRTGNWHANLLRRSAWREWIRTALALNWPCRVRLQAIIVLLQLTLRGELCFLATSLGAPKTPRYNRMLPGASEPSNLNVRWTLICNIRTHLRCRALSLSLQQWSFRYSGFQNVYGCEIREEQALWRSSVHRGLWTMLSILSHQCHRFLE